MKPGASINKLHGPLTLVILLAAIGLTGCSPAEVAAGSEEINSGAQAAVLELVDSEPAGSIDVDQEQLEQVSIQLPSQTLVDRQGAVEVAVTPQIEATVQSGRLVFEVAMNTHSVDLSMDLAESAELVTDTGLTLPALSWSGGSGHHVTGYLEFALPEGAASSQFAEAKNWVLTIRGVEVNQRVFIWDIG